MIDLWPMHNDKGFSVIAISETWLNGEKGADEELEGYEMFFINRINKKRGGVALYGDTPVKCKIVESTCTSTTIDNVMECITVEIDVEK